MLVTLGQALHLGKPGVEGHGWVSSVLSEIEEGGPPQLLLNDQRLLQQFESSGQKLVFDLQEISFSDIHLEWLIDDVEPQVILDVLPSPVSVADNPCQQPVVVSPVPDLVLSPGHRG